jgi:hypothetical protein
MIALRRHPGVARRQQQVLAALSGVGGREAHVHDPALVDVEDGPEQRTFRHRYTSGPACRSRSMPPYGVSEFSVKPTWRG